MGGETNDTTTNLNPTFNMPSSSPKSSSFTSSYSSNIFPNFIATSSQRQFNNNKDETESQGSSESSVDSIFGSVPTQLEVEYAIATFQSLMMRDLSSLDEVELLVNQQDSSLVESIGFQRVYDAFRLLQTKSSVRRMVAYISTDKTVWNVVMRNNDVQEFRRSLPQAKASRTQGMLDNMKLRVVQLIETLKSLVVLNNIESYKSKNNDSELKEDDDGFEELIIPTVILSTIALTIVLVTRAYNNGA